MAPPSRAVAERLSLLVVVWWNHQLLTRLNLVGIVKFIAVRVEDAHVLIRVSIELLTDLR